MDHFWYLDGMAWSKTKRLFAMGVTPREKNIYEGFSNLHVQGSKFGGKMDIK